MLTACENPLRAMDNIVYRNSVIMVALLCILPIASLGQTTGTAQNTPTPLGKLVDVGGYRVYLYCTGTGSPAVVIVGAGFSFNWGLVQPEVAKFTEVCSYDHSGIGWSDDGPKDSCSLRVNEVHNALKNAGVNGPYVLVGHSLGALVARLYAGRYPDEVAGMVFVDHAITFPLKILAPPPSVATTAPAPPPKASGPSGGGGIESDPNFSKLSPRDRDLHLWFMSQARNQRTLQSNHEIMPECVAQADAISKEHPHPLGHKPLVDVSTDEGAHSPDYAKLQADLLSLSENSKQLVAENSSHFIIIDRPDVVIDAIKQAVQSIRNNAAAGAADKEDNSAVVGVWRGELDTLPEATLNVTDEAGPLQGATLFYLIRKHEGRAATSSPGVPEPLFNPQFDRQSLTFQMSHRHAHRNTASDPPVTFRPDLTGPDEAKLVRVSVDGPAYVPMVRDKNWK